MALVITRDPDDNEKLEIRADIAFDSVKSKWMDGIYFIASNLNISIWFEKEAEEKLIEFLFNPKIKEEEG